MTKTKFDVAITTFRRPDMVVAAVLSCLRQGERLGSVVVVDDASGDETRERIAGLGDGRIVFHERAANGGIGAARRDAFSLCTSDWTVTLDSDHELLPGALDRLASHIDSLGPEVGIIGARYQWDTGLVTPAVVPDHPLDYQGRIEWASRPDGIGSDYLCCISRAVRERVTWSSERSGAVDSLFHLDAARLAQASFLPDCLALQRSDGPFGHSRGDAQYLLARQLRDAAGAVAVCKQILNSHGPALQRWGRPQLAVTYKLGILSAALAAQRSVALRWACEGLFRCGPRLIGLRAVIGGIIGGRMFRWAYLKMLRRRQSFSTGANAPGTTHADSPG